MADESIRPTLLSSLQTTTASSSVNLSTAALHPFSTAAEPTISFLRSLIDTTEHLAHSTNVHLVTDSVIRNSKTVSTLRQQTAGQNSLHLTSNHVAQIIAATRESSTSYGEDIPPDSSKVAEWCIARIVAWATAAGMQVFPDADGDGRRMLSLSGPVLVLDVVLTERPRIAVASVHASYAVPHGAGGATGSVSLDGYLADTLGAFVEEVQKAEDADVEEASRRGKRVSESLQYLMQLDKLAMREGDAGIRWFSDVDALGAILEGFAQSEAEAVASTFVQSAAPLDILLLRGHALPLPYLHSPTLSFLVHISPLTYLSLKRSAPAVPPVPALPPIDIPFAHLRTVLGSHPNLRGATTVTLSLAPVKTSIRPPPSADIPTLTQRPTFALAPAAVAFQHTLPVSAEAPDSDQHLWTLDFTRGGASRGVVMSQSRMRDIEVVVNPLSQLGHMTNADSMTFGTGSWVDLLLNPPSTPISPEHYSAVYTSPNGLHPPLVLRLTAPEEPGYLLERVHVYDLKEVYGILEIVREQCWLNEILTGCDWTPEGLLEETVDESQEATEDELQAILNGTYPPIKMPVNVYLPTASALVLSCPEHPPIPGLIDIVIAYDASRPRGVAIDVRGAMSADIHVDVLEEAVRRGGAFGLPGRVWAGAQRAP
ncbi:hypothetical protein FA95DRAFT_1497228 [Auriscalpium vulgare]|uniref:Uncharacterized protein n=1 Tax=Auriscalpium vulgare TaxID=40419 RepID=A0ACB8RKY8_9AGAM|nr:hypothetical protein FA95DRAFT_1497228 [Auriscalpium vulgare]